MCGIAGVVYQDRNRIPDRELVTRMCDAIRHRGPDDFGLHLTEGAGLGHRRLSIIDLSPAGHQPMSNEDDTIWVAFNGEIYNFAELREELVAKGHQFRSQSDTEVIVHLYEEHGTDCIERLAGMFGIALWDANRRRLLLARDRFGKKPIKYFEKGGDLYFSSELKSLLATREIDASPRLEDIDSYLSFGYVPSPGTGLEDIRKLPPGHLLVWEDGESRIRPYWSIDYSEKQTMSEPEWTSAVRDTVMEAVGSRMVADVPLGAFLSGGIDSSIVVACMSRLSEEPIETFSIGFEHEEYDELSSARAVAEWCGTSHHEFVVRADDSSILPELARLYEEPFADPSALPSYFLARETRRFVTVALSGDGGDEGFLGYNRYRRLEDLTRRTALLRRIPGLRPLLRGIAAAGTPPRWARRADFLAGVLSESVGERYLWLIRQSTDREKDRLDGGLLMRARTRLPAERVEDWVSDPRAGQALGDQLCFADIQGYLPGQVLPKVDIATMAHSLESRAPLLDHRVVELAASAPISIRAGSSRPKHLLQAAFADFVPPGHFDRPKQGFGIPLDPWFRGPWRGLLEEVLIARDARVADYLDRRQLEKIVSDHVAGRINHGHRLWSLLMLELWHREVVERA